MLEYLNFCLLCVLFALIFYLYSWVKRYLPILKMAEELIGNLGYETPQSDTNHQKLLECVLTGKVLGQNPPDKNPLDINPQTITPWTKTPLAKTPPDKTFFSEIL